MHFTREDGVQVDLHWELGPMHFQGWFRAGSFLERLVEREIAGRRVAGFSGEDLLRYLCVHAAKHGWLSLRDVADLARLIASGVDCERAVSDAEKYGGVRVVLAGLEIARQLGRAELSPAVVRRIQGDTRVARLVRASVWNMQSVRGPLGTKAMLRWQWRLLDRASDRARLVWGLMQPSSMNREWVRLPECLYPAYFLLKPVRLASKYLL
jgi:hypothetical protein